MTSKKQRIGQGFKPYNKSWTDFCRFMDYEEQIGIQGEQFIAEARAEGKEEAIKELFELFEKEKLNSYSIYDNKQFRHIAMQSLNNIERNLFPDLIIKRQKDLGFLKGKEEER